MVSYWSSSSCRSDLRNAIYFPVGAISEARPFVLLPVGAISESRPFVVSGIGVPSYKERSPKRDIFPSRSDLRIATVRGIGNRSSLLQRAISEARPFVLLPVGAISESRPFVVSGIGVPSYKERSLKRDRSSFFL